MILKDPYKSQLQKLNYIDDIKKNINIYLTLSYSYIQTQERNKDIQLRPFVDINRTLNPVALYGVSDTEGNVASFTHPLINEENHWIAMDLRPYVTVDRQDGTFSIRNKSEFNLHMARWVMSGMYATGNESVLYGLKFPHFAFGHWIADSLTHKFGLSLGDQLKIRIVALIYYVSMFKNTPLNEEDLEKLLIRTSKEVVVPKLVTEIFEQVKEMNSLTDMLNSLYDVTGNVRLKGMDTNVSINIFSNSWMGNAAKEMCVLALEHPPTWIALVQTALIERTFKRSTIATLANRINKRGSGTEFLSSLSGILNGYRVSDNSPGF